MDSGGELKSVHLAHVRLDEDWADARAEQYVTWKELLVRPPTAPPVFVSGSPADMSSTGSAALSAHNGPVLLGGPLSGVAAIAKATQAAKSMSSGLAGALAAASQPLPEDEPSWETCSSMGPLCGPAGSAPNDSIHPSDGGDVLIADRDFEAKDGQAGLLESMAPDKAEGEVTAPVEGALKVEEAVPVEEKAAEPRGEAPKTEEVLAPVEDAAKVEEAVPHEESPTLVGTTAPPAEEAPKTEEVVALVEEAAKVMRLLQRRRPLRTRRRRCPRQTRLQQRRWMRLPRLRRLLRRRRRPRVRRRPTPR